MSDVKGHGLYLLKELQEPNWLHDLQARGIVRASINVRDGVVQGMGFVYASEPMMASPEGAPICVPGVPCDVYELYNFLARSSVIRPAECIAFVLHEIHPGQRRAYEEHVTRVAEEAGGVDMAAAHLIGRGRYHGLTEAVSADREQFLRTLVQITDFSGFVSSQVLRVFPDDTRGMGHIDEGAPAG